YGLRFGIELFRKQGIEINEIRLTGGGARSKKWRQIVADVMNTPVICVTNQEAAALGAAIQAMWCDSLAEEKDKQAQLAHLCQYFVHLDEETRTVPTPETATLYDVFYQDYLSLLTTEYPEVKI
ncbi:xylulokinase, partial [Photorhabdus kleinii]